MPGLQIESYNTRTIMVPEERADEAREAFAELSPTNEAATASSMRLRDKARVVLEAVLFGWFVESSKKKWVE